MFVWDIFCKCVNVQIFKHFKLQFFKATCMLLYDSYGFCSVSKIWLF